MTSVCYTPFKVPRVRVTKLNSCGLPVTGCSTVVSDGIITVALTYEYEDREEFFVKNADGAFCVRETNPPILKWINAELTWCNVDPELVNILSANSLVLNDAASPVAMGFNDEEAAPSSANFAFEAWTRLSNNGGNPCSGGTEYGYMLLPWNKETTLGDVTYENGAANFITNSRTSGNSPWGLGPYWVDYSDNPAGSTTQVRLLTPILSTQHRRMFITRLAPPTAACGCSTLSSLTPS
jgi:hypothetical protein